MDKQIRGIAACNRRKFAGVDGFAVYRAEEAIMPIDERPDDIPAVARQEDEACVAKFVKEADEGGVRDVFFAIDSVASALDAWQNRLLEDGFGFCESAFEGKAGLDIEIRNRLDRARAIGGLIENARK